jgi:hypothetical protein
MQFNNARKRITLAACAVTTGLTLCAGAAHAQFNQFQSAFGNANTEGGGLTPVITTQDGGIIPTWDENLIQVSDTRDANGNFDIYVAKLDLCGDILWAKTYDLGGNDHSRKIRQYPLPDGGYAIVGYTDRGQDRDAFLMRINSIGGVVWAKTYGVTGRNKSEEGKDLRVDAAGNIYACGTSRSAGAGDVDGWIWSTFPNGNPRWGNLFGGFDVDVLNALELGCNGSVIATGSTSSFSPPDYDIDLWIVKVDQITGNFNYSTIHGAEGSEEGKGIAIDSDGVRFYVVGFAAGDGGPGVDALAGQFYCETGLCQLARNFGGVNNNDICFNDVIFDPASVASPSPGLWITGSDAMAGPGSSATRLVRLTAPGLTSTWGKLYYGSTYSEFGYSLTTTLFDNNPRYGLAVVGSTGSFGQGNRDIYTIGTDLNGVSGCNEENSIPPYKDYQPYKNDYVTPTITLFQPLLTTTYSSQETSGFTTICSACHPSMIAPPEGGRGDLSRNEAGQGVEHVRVDLQSASLDVHTR